MNKRWDLAAEREILADACQRSFWLFLKYAFGAALNPEGRDVRGNPWLDLEVHEPLCHWFQEKIEHWEKTGEQTFILIAAVRDSGKTVIITKAGTVWLQLRHPDLSSLISSVTGDKSIEFMDVVRKLWEGKDGYALWAWLYGLWEDPDSWTKSRFTHRARKANISEASIETCSVETGKTGGHPRHVVIDDPVTLEKLRDQGNWLALANTHVGSLFPVMKKDALFIICATPYEDGDVVTSSIRQDGIKDLHGHKLPPEYQNHQMAEGRWLMYHMPGAEEDGTPLVPTCWPPERINYYRKKWPERFASQVLLRPGAGEKVPLSIEQIKDYLIKRKDVPKNLTFTFHLDTAFKNKDTVNSGDWSVIEIWGHHPETGDVYFMEGHGSNKWREEEFTDHLVTLAKRFWANNRRVRWLTDEKIIGGKEGLWRNHLVSCFANAGMFLPPFLEVSRAGKKKEQRIRIAAGYWVDGHVFLCEDAPGLDDLMWQMSRIGVSAHDDWADAAADVFHPEIYKPFRPPASAGAMPPLPRRPWDGRLKDGELDDESRALYDMSWGGYNTREPIR